MTNALVPVVARLMGLGIMAGLFLFMALPLLMGLSMAFKLVRYREWLAIPAALLSIALLAESGDYIYNVMNWTASRPSLAMTVTVCALSFVAPPFLLILGLMKSRWRVAWGLGMLLFIGLALVASRSEFLERKARDAEAYRQGVQPLTPRTGTNMVTWWIDPHSYPARRFLLQGHIPEGTPVALLADPFFGSFRAQFCTGSASTYRPPAKDPAVVSNVTEVAELKDCPISLVQGVAVLERGVSVYRSIPFEPLADAPDRKILTHPLVQERFSKLGYDPANFEIIKIQSSRDSGQKLASIFITPLAPRKRPPDAFPCADPAIVISVNDPGNVKAVLPYCALGWNLFQLNDDLYFAATTQPPTPPGEEIMNPDQTRWLMRVEGAELKQVWPAP